VLCRRRGLLRRRQDARHHGRQHGSSRDLATGKEVPPPGDGTEAVTCVAFLADGKTPVTAGSDHTLRHWGSSHGDRRSSVPRHSRGRRVLRRRGQTPGTSGEKGSPSLRPGHGKELRVRVPRLSFPARPHAGRQSRPFTPSGKTGRSGSWTRSRARRGSHASIRVRPGLAMSPADDVPGCGPVNGNCSV
jgi:hypothetical protein